MKIAAVLSMFVVCVSVNTATADNWPAWRGPSADGVSREKNLPVEWSGAKNIRWKVPLPDRGNSTPVVWGSRIFITQAIESEGRRTVMCLDRVNGRLLWQSGTAWKEKEETHPDNPYCSASPATDGERVIVSFGSAGVYCYDFDGKELWHRDLGKQQHEWGYASSPVLYRGLCLLNFGPGERSFIIALDKRSGRSQAKWRGIGPPRTAAGYQSCCYRTSVIDTTRPKLAKACDGCAKLCSLQEAARSTL